MRVKEKSVDELPTVSTLDTVNYPLVRWLYQGGAVRWKIVRSNTCQLQIFNMEHGAIIQQEADTAIENAMALRFCNWPFVLQNKAYLPKQNHRKKGLPLFRNVKHARSPAIIHKSYKASNALESYSTYCTTALHGRQVIYIVITEKAKGPLVQLALSSGMKIYIKNKMQQMLTCVHKYIVQTSSL